MISAIELSDVIFATERGGLLGMIAFYGDDSADRLRERIITAGGIFGWPVNFFQASLQWKERLDKDHIDYFHATECESLTGQFDPAKHGDRLNSVRAMADSVRRDLIDIIEKNNLDTIALSLLMRDFKEVLSEIPDARHRYGKDATILLYRRLIKTMIDEIRNQFPNEVVAFELDTHSNYQRAERAYEEVRQSFPSLASMMAGIGHSDDKRLVPLQMADLWAMEARHWTLAQLDGIKVERPGFKALRQADAIFHIALINKEGLISGLQK